MFLNDYFIQNCNCNFGCCSSRWCALIEKENEKVARPFAIYCDEKYEYPNDRYWLWRFMIDENLQGNGYGTAALQVIQMQSSSWQLKKIRVSDGGYPPSDTLI